MKKIFEENNRNGVIKCPEGIDQYLLIGNRRVIHFLGVLPSEYCISDGSYCMFDKEFNLSTRLTFLQLPKIRCSANVSGVVGYLCRGIT